MMTKVSSDCSTNAISVFIPKIRAKQSSCNLLATDALQKCEEGNN